MTSKIFKYIKRLFLGLCILVILLIIVAVLFVNLSPEFGAKASEAQIAAYKTSKNYDVDRFVNNKRINVSMSFSDFRKSMSEYFSHPNTVPKKNIDVKTIDSLQIATYTGNTRFFWFGHSTFLLQIDGKTILLDPMLGEVPAPHPLLGNKRFSDQLPINAEKLPKIDAVLISHDHYDHLDYSTIEKIKDKVRWFITPLGVGVHLEAWGVEKSKIIELDWWQEKSIEGVIFKCTPAQHFSGRGLTDQFKTLWSSWIVQSKEDNIYFSGDSAYSSHFKEIGEKYGPFNFAMLECGQYNTMWPDVHMFPEETAQAGIDLKANTIMPIHWGAFKLAMHPWTEPIERVKKKANELNIQLIAPEIGAPVVINKLQPWNTNWWQSYTSNLE